MRYILCIFLPPFAVLSTGKIFHAMFNFLLTLFFWIPGVIHAFFVVNNWKTESRFQHLERKFVKNDLEAWSS